MIWLFTEYFHFMEFVHSQTLGIPWVLIKLRVNEDYWEISVFSLTFPVLCKFTFPIFWELYGFLLHPKYLRNLLLWNVCVFPYFSLTMGIHFFHILGIVCISASLKLFEKPITLEYLFFFSHTFPALWKFTFPKFCELYGFLLHPKYLRNS